MEEANESFESIPKVIRKMIKNLSSVSRDTFLQEAVKCEASNNLLTCECIIEQSIVAGDLQNLGPKELKIIWLQNVDVCLQQGAIFTARFILKAALKLHDRRALWLKAFQIEK